MSPHPPPQLVDFVWWADRASVLGAPGGEWLTFVIMTVLANGSTGFVPNTVSNSFREKYKKQKKMGKMFIAVVCDKTTVCNAKVYNAEKNHQNNSGWSSYHWKLLLKRF